MYFLIFYVLRGIATLCQRFSLNDPKNHILYKPGRDVARKNYKPETTRSPQNFRILVNEIFYVIGQYPFFGNLFKWWINILNGRVLHIVTELDRVCGTIGKTHGSIGVGFAILSDQHRFTVLCSFAYRFIFELLSNLSASMYKHFRQNKHNVSFYNTF